MIQRDCATACQWAQVIDPVEDYVKLMKRIYDFGGLRTLLKRPDFKFCFDAMHGVAGPYARRIFVQVGDTASGESEVVLVRVRVREPELLM